MSYPVSFQEIAFLFKVARFSFCCFLKKALGWDPQPHTAEGRRDRSTLATGIPLGDTPPQGPLPPPAAVPQQAQITLHRLGPCVS